MSRRGVLGAGTATIAAGSAGAAQAQSAARRVRRQETVMVPMRDGVKIALSYWLPEGEGPFPAILMRSLDRRRYVRRLAMLDDLLAAGYAFVSSDVRGRFESEGEFDPTYGPKEGRDGVDTLAWMAAQPWCDGRIGTYGLSHQASYQVSTALQHPPQLKAMATWTGGFRGAGSQRVEGAPPPVSGGVSLLGTLMVWLPNEAGAALDKLGGAEAAEAKRVLRRMRTHPEETFTHLPLREAPITKFAGVRELFAYRLDRDARPAGGAGTPYEELKVPTFHECGWFDPAAWSQFQGFDGMLKRGGTPEARAGQHMVAGPWQHAMVFQDRLGDFYFGTESDNDGSGINRLQVKFFDRYVKGAKVELPRVRYFLMGPNEWRETSAWPPPQMKRRRLYLRSAGRANGVEGDGRLAWDAPKAEPADRFDYDPLKPIPTLGGSFNGTMSVPGMIPGPLEQSAIERRRDVLVYTSPPLDEDLEMSGPITLKLFASTSAVDTDFTGKVCQVLPDGRSYNLGDGILRLSGRNLKGEREPVKAGETYELMLGLGHTSVVLRKGTRIRLQVSSSNFPQFDRNMNTGNPVGTDAKGVVAHQSVLHSGLQASWLELPLAPATEA